MNEIVQWFISSGIAEELVVIIISALPIIELRGSLPVAINLFHMPWYRAFCLALLGNLLPVPILLLFFDTIAKVLSKIETGRKMVNWILERTRRGSRVIDKYERIGLTLFVAVPLPITGAWTGSIAAFLCGMKFHHAFLAITCGLIIAGTIVTCLSLLGWTGAVIAGVGLSMVVVLAWWRV